MNLFLRYALASFIIAGVLFFSVQATATDMPIHNQAITPTIGTATHMVNDVLYTLPNSLNTPQNQNLLKIYQHIRSSDTVHRASEYTTLIDEYVCTCPFCHLIRVLVNSLPDNNAEIPKDDQVLSILITTNNDAIFHHTSGSPSVSPIFTDKRNFKIVLKQ